MSTGLPVFLAVICLALASCTLDETSPAPVATGAETQVTDQAATMEKWSRSCALCHVNGEGGAPRIGQSQEWAPRLAEGETVMLRRMIEGYNNMPPLGYCMDCTSADLLDLTRFMAGDP